MCGSLIGHSHRTSSGSRKSCFHPHLPASRLVHIHYVYFISVQMKICLCHRTYKTTENVCPLQTYSGLSVDFKDCLSFAPPNTATLMQLILFLMLSIFASCMPWSSKLTDITVECTKEGN